jgi:hypothetical protein
MTLVHSEGTDNLSFGKTVLENWLVFKYRWDKTEEVRTLHTEQEVRDELSRLQLDGWTMEGLY